MIVSALGAIQKSDNKIRLIHDASRPEGESLNDFCQKEPFQYSSVQDGVDMISPGYYLAKLDLKAAFRSVRTHSSNFQYCGLKWTFSGDREPTYLIDTRLPFGARRSPYLFNELSQAVVRIMCSRGYPNIVCYLDDYLICEATHHACAETLNELLKVLRVLGFAINYNKIVGPTTRLSFLGITLDSSSMTVELPKDKLDDLRCLLLDARGRSRITKRQLQSLIGKLNFATQCVFGGRFFLRRLHDAVCRLRLPWHRTRITVSIRRDIDWWLRYLSEFNGLIDMVDPRPRTPIHTDACTIGCGAVYENKFVYFRWNEWPEADRLHINHKETLAFEVALTTWADKLRNSKVIIHCDNQTAVAVLNRGSSRNECVMASLRRVFWLAAKYNLRLEVVYTPGKSNNLADGASRLHEGARVWRGTGLYPVLTHNVFFQEITREAHSCNSIREYNSSPAGLTPNPRNGLIDDTANAIYSSATDLMNDQCQPRAVLYVGTLCTSPGNFVSIPSSST